ncbi:MAG: Na/Pi cotransporter family protein [Eubacterium sp.]|nr:Na/Pi cotransporter family protein [Eubacterium sp.]
MDIISILKLFGGVGLFLYGMSLMGQSLEKLAGGELEKILEKLTTSKKKGVGSIKGWALGTAVTAIIQSSAATTIMLIGFVNAGIMKVIQAVPVVFGANIGSTVTAQILRLGDLGSGSIVLQLLKPSSFAPMLVAVGAFILLFIKKKKPKNIAGILIGLGILFYGMTIMEEVFEPLRESTQFQKLFVSFSNPILGVLIGIIITAIIQSSSASVGILQALSATGTVTFSIAIPIIIGQNIGKCMPIVMAGIGANKKAKRVQISYIFMNIFGAIIFLLLIYGLYYTVGLPFMEKVVNRGDIANVHFGFNFLTSIILLPFTEKFTQFTAKLVGGEEESKTDTALAKLDERLLNTPTIALEQCKTLVGEMKDAIYENYKTATSLIYEYDANKFVQLEENENFIDRCETLLTAYIIKIDRKRLSTDEKLVVSEILNSISDLERTGDYCMNIAYVARDKNEQGIHFSPSGHKEVNTIISAVDYVLKTTFKSFSDEDASLAIRVEPISESVDKLKEIIKSHHVERLNNGTCSIQGGVALFDLINCFERISSHCSNIALHVIKRVGGDRDFDEMHGHANDSYSEEYKALYHYYESLFIDPVLPEKQKEAPVADFLKEEEAKSEKKMEKEHNKKKSKDKHKKKKDDK